MNPAQSPRSSDAFGLGPASKNEHWCALTEYSSHEVLGRSIFDGTNNIEDIGADHEQFRRQIAGALDRYTIEKPIRRKDGSYVWASTTSLGVHDAGGLV